MANGKRLNQEPSKRNLTELEKCGALTRAGTACGAMAGGNTPHPGYGRCSKHGGNTGAGLKWGAREAGRDFMKKYKLEHSQSLRFGGDRTHPSIANLTPEQALVEEVRRSAAMVRFLEDRIGQWGLDFDSAAMEIFVAHPNGVRYRDPALRKKVDEFLNGLPEEDESSPRHLPDLVQTNSNTGISSFTNKREWLFLYREERAHLARVAKMALDAGVASRLVSLAEDQGRILSSALRVILQALRLTPEQSAMIPIIVPTVLRAVANDQPLPSLEELMGVTPDNSRAAIEA